MMTAAVTALGSLALAVFPELDAVGRVFLPGSMFDPLKLAADGTGLAWVKVHEPFVLDAGPYQEPIGTATGSIDVAARDAETARLAAQRLLDACNGSRMVPSVYQHVRAAFIQESNHARWNVSLTVRVHSE